MTQTTSRRSFLAAFGAALVSPRFMRTADTVPPLLDHILLGCSNLAGGVSFVEERLGVRAAFGGVHPGRGTQNALLSLGLRHYLEIIAPDPQQAREKLPQALDLQRRHLHELIQPRLVGWAEHPGNLDRFAARLREAGIAFNGPRPGARRRPDGRVLEWKALTLADDRNGILPFFIEWSAGSLHPSADAPHGAKLGGFSIADPNPDDLAKFCKSLDLDVAVERNEKPQMGAVIAGAGDKIMRVTS
jgi:Glyoxalase-like domain